MTKNKFIEQGIDISHWNKVKDFGLVKKSGIDFVIIKAGGSDKGFYADRQFENYYRLAKLSGLKVGAYYYVGKNFYGTLSGIEDAKRFYRIIQGKDFDYPVCLDLESTSKAYKEQATDAAKAFCDYLESMGCYVSIYGSDISTFKEMVNLEELEKYDKWVARYSKKGPVFVKDFGMWQKSSSGCVPGIVGAVDLDESYKDYQKIMITNNLNRG